MDVLPNEGRHALEKEIVDSLVELGYDGATFKNTKANSIETTLFKDNLIRDIDYTHITPDGFRDGTLFKDGKFIPPENRAGIVETLKKDLLDPENNYSHDAEWAREFETYKAELPEELKFEEVVKEIDEIKLPEGSKRLEQVNEMKQKVETFEELVSDIEKCVY